MPCPDVPGAVPSAPGLFYFQSVLWQTNSLVLARRGQALVVDPGYFPREILAIQDFLADQRLEPTLLFSHGDFDHVVGHQAFRGAPRWGSVAMLARDAPAVERQVLEYDQRFYVDRPEPFSFPALDWAVPTADGAAGPGKAPVRARLTDLDLLFYPAPGHTADGLLTVVPELGLLIAGDYLSGLEFPFVEFSLTAYRETLNLVRRLTDEFHLTTLAPGHGPLAVTQDDLLVRVGQDEAYLEALANAVRRGAAAGRSERDIVEGLETLSYRGRRAPDHLLGQHRDNIRLAIREAMAQ